jgi:hypothetical protein
MPTGGMLSSSKNTRSPSSCFHWATSRRTQGLFAWLWLTKMSPPVVPGHHRRRLARPGRAPPAVDPTRASPGA